VTSQQADKMWVSVVKLHNSQSHSSSQLSLAHIHQLMPNTHRRRDSTVELSRVSVASASAVCIEFATSSRPLPKLNMLRIYPVESSRVVSAVRTRPSAVVTQFTILQPMTAAENWKLGHD